MLKEIAVEGCTLVIPQASPGYTIDIVSDPEEFVKVCGQKPYAKEMKVTIANATTGSITDGNGRNMSDVVIKPTAISGKANHKLCLRKGDKATNVQLVGTTLGNTAYDWVTVEIVDAGQSYVKCE